MKKQLWKRNMYIKDMNFYYFNFLWLKCNNEHLILICCFLFFPLRREVLKYIHTLCDFLSYNFVKTKYHDRLVKLKEKQTDITRIFIFEKCNLLKSSTSNDPTRVFR